MATERKLRRVTLYCDRGHDVPERLADAIKWFAARLDGVPPEYRNEVNIEFGTDGDYESPSPELDIGYWRPETDEEMAQREAQEIAHREYRRQSEIASARAILAKHGEKP